MIRPTMGSVEEYTEKLLGAVLFCPSNSDRSGIAWCQILELARFVDTLPWDQQPTLNVLEFFEASDRDREEDDLASTLEGVELSATV